MLDPHSLIQARQFGEVRYAVVSESTGEMSRVLAKLGLKPEPEALVEHDRESAYLILRDLLWKDMAYEGECMPIAQAESLAQQILQEHSVEGSRYFSNGNWPKREGWNPLTESTFDAGILVSQPPGRYFCIWFQDED